MFFSEVIGASKSPVCEALFDARYRPTHRRGGLSRLREKYYSKPSYPRIVNCEFTCLMVSNTTATVIKSEVPLI